MKKLLLVTVFGLFACLSNAQENATETTYYQKIPRLVKQADGTYRVTGDYYFVPVEKNGTVDPVAIAKKTEQEETASAESGTPKSNRNDLPGGRPYLSVGISLAKNTATEEESLAGVSVKTKYTDTQPNFKVAYGSQFNPYFRMEVFYQYRNKIQDEGKISGIPWEATAKMNDLGINAFVAANANNKARFFIGAGLAATRVQPTVKVYGIKSDELFESGWFATPSGFIGIEFADNSGHIVTDITAFYSKTFINKEYTDSGYTDTFKDIVAYGVQLNFRFNL